MRVLLLATVLLHGTAISGCAEPQQESEAVIRVKAERPETAKTNPAVETNPAIETVINDTQRPLRSWKFVILHHTATSSGSVESIDADHKTRRDANGRQWKGIGYHFLIGNGHGMPDGDVQATFRWDQQLAGAHAGDAEYNELGIGVCLVGNFEETPPTPAQLTSTQQLLQALRGELKIEQRQILRHGDLKATACPGRLFPYAELLDVQREFNHHPSNSISDRPKERVEPAVAGVIKEGRPYVGSEQSLSTTRQ